MQIGICRQPINHILAATRWAARHVPADASYSQFALRRSNISLHRGYVGHIENIQFSSTLKLESGAACQRSHLSQQQWNNSFFFFFYVQQESSFKLSYVAYLKRVQSAVNFRIYVTWLVRSKCISNVRVNGKNTKPIVGFIVELKISICCFRLKQVISLCILLILSTFWVQYIAYMFLICSH